MVVQVEIQAGPEDRCLFEVSGRLDCASYPQLQAQFDQVNWRQTRTLVLDLKALRHISSAGICCILKARRDGMLQGGRLYLMNLQPQVHKTFAILKALPTEEIFSSQQEFEAFLAGSRS
ncbi:MAG: STAS domain-containing protein [Candidatus Eremiobacteraeota bacterium]|nr:STAS domain-containing protein [Candidatus Eremiobacteraeota bacterium]